MWSRREHQLGLSSRRRWAPVSVRSSRFPAAFWQRSSPHCRSLCTRLIVAVCKPPSPIGPARGSVGSCVERLMWTAP